MNYSFSAGDITTSADGTVTYSDSLQSALDNVQSLVDDYNEAISYTSKNSDVSNRMKTLASTFSDTTYRSGVYSGIGISVDSTTGKLTVDTETLANALVENGDRVQNALGSNGLAGKAESHADLALSQADKLFPSMQSMIGDELEAASIYSGSVLSNINTYTTAGNLIDLMF